MRGKERVAYKFLGLLFLWGMIIFTVMQQDTILWILSAISSIILMHFISKGLKVGGISQLGLQFQKGWLRYFLFGSLIGISYQLVRFTVMFSTGMIKLQEVAIDSNSFIFSTLILLVSTAYIGFSEEIVFRGYLINMFPSSFSNKLVLVISSLLFTLGHFANGGFDFFRMTELFFVGLFLALCYVSTRSLWFVAGIHWFWNFTWYYLGADGGSSSSKLVDVSINQERLSYLSWIDVAMAFGILLLMLFIMKRSSIKKNTITG